jgi:uncharacterized protein YrrD
MQTKGETLAGILPQKRKYEEKNTFTNFKNIRTFFKKRVYNV